MRCRRTLSQPQITYLTVVPQDYTGAEKSSLPGDITAQSSRVCGEAGEEPAVLPVV